MHATSANTNRESSIGSDFRCAACACALEFTDVPLASHSNATSVEESFVLLAPELAMRAKREGVLIRSSSTMAPMGLPRGQRLGRDEGAMQESFVVLPKEDAELGRGGTGAGTARASVLTRLFDVACALSARDHPLCDGCASAVIHEVRKKTAEAEAECEAYEETLERLSEAQTEEGDEVDGGALRMAAREMANAEKEAEEMVLALENELAATRAARRKLAKKATALDDAEGTYWREFHAFKKNLNAHMEKRDSILARIDQAQNHMTRLEKTNVFNDAFHIWTDGAFGTINGFRLGRLPNVAVEWDEINAAFGLACLLLHSMARICKFSFTQFTLKPLGSFPRVFDSKGNVYELFGPVSIISSHKYDKAVLGFLTCLSELSEFMRERDIRQGVNPPFELPFAISGDKVDGKKMSFTFNRDENWTYALKLCLTNLKLMLAWLSHKD